jgi:hypothetical protein
LSQPEAGKEKEKENKRREDKTAFNEKRRRQFWNGARPGVPWVS